MPLELPGGNGLSPLRYGLVRWHQPDHAAIPSLQARGFFAALRSLIRQLDPGLLNHPRDLPHRAIHDGLIPATLCQLATTESNQRSKLTTSDSDAARTP